MSWITENKGWLVACCVSAVAGALLVLWLKGSKPKTILPNPVVDTPAPVQPDFESDSAKIARIEPARWRLGGSIGETDGSAIDTLTKPTPTPAPEQKSAVSRPEPSPCKPFQLRLVSSPTSLSSVLDSVVVDYFYPSGMQSFEYYTRPQKDSPLLSSTFRFPTLSVGFATNYLRYQNNLEGFAYVRLRISGLSVESGYHHQTHRQLGWYVGLRKEFVLF